MSHAVHITLPAPVVLAVNRLLSVGASCFPVGGCVRDTLRGKTPEDWDLCTSAPPDLTYACLEGFDRFIISEIHGTVGVIIDGMKLEITTFRLDEGYSDGRHPDRVRFTDSLIQDLSRRDFTINAMALGPDGAVIDPFGGQADLKAGIIRCVGDPYLRLREDSLRLLRALRFASVLGFTIEPETAAALAKERNGISRIARERIFAEWEKLLAGPMADRVVFSFPEVIEAALPYLQSLLCNRDRLKPALDRMMTASAPIARFARLLASLGQSASLLSAEPIAKQTRQTLDFLISREAEPIPDAKDVATWLRQNGPLAPSLAPLLWEGKNGCDAALSELNRILQDGICFSLSGKYGLRVDGNDVIRLTSARGKEIRRTLEHLLDLVMDGTLSNDRDTLLTYLSKNGR